MAVLTEKTRRQMRARLSAAAGLLAIAVPSTGCSGSSAVLSAQPPATGAALPLEFILQLPTTQAEIAGEPLNLVVDLGGHDTVTLTKEAIERIPGVPGAGVERGWLGSFASDAAGRIRYSRPFRIPHLRVGAIEFLDVKGHEINIRERGEPEALARLDGYIGAGILKQFRVLVDYPDRVILFPPDGPLDLNSPGWTPGPSVAIDSMLRSRGSVEGEELIIGWDTGANHTVIDRKAATRLFDTGEGRVDMSISLGGVEYGPIRVAISDLSGARVDMLLGFSFFSAYKVLFDFERGEALIESSAVNR